MTLPSSHCAFLERCEIVAEIETYFVVSNKDPWSAWPEDRGLEYMPMLHVFEEHRSVVIILHPGRSVPKVVGTSIENSVFLYPRKYRRKTRAKEIYVVAFQQA